MTKQSYYDPSNTTLSPIKTAKYDNGFLGKQGAVHIKPRLLEAHLADNDKF